MRFFGWVLVAFDIAFACVNLAFYATASHWWSLAAGLLGAATAVVQTRLTLSFPRRLR